MRRLSSGRVDWIDVAASLYMVLVALLVVVGVFAFAVTR